MPRSRTAMKSRAYPQNLSSKRHGRRAPWRYQGAPLRRRRQVFGPKPREYEVVLPQKIRQGALREAVALRNSEGKLWIIEAWSQGTQDKKGRATI
jgi:ribosomal protein L4